MLLILLLRHNHLGKSVKLMQKLQSYSDIWIENGRLEKMACHSPLEATHCHLRNYFSKFPFCTLLKKKI